ncbi:MAG: hypothetical protein GX456_15725 [Verrucomicrobia bacterium]|nr:hypothetical protein [Verrucomicrobiota bacterium]
MEFTKDINDKIREQARRIQDEVGMSALTRPEICDAAAQRVLDTLTPLQIGEILHPGCRGVALADVPASVLEEHRRRYTDEDLREGQFVIVTGSTEHYVFIMGHETKGRKNREKAQ